MNKFLAVGLLVAASASSTSAMASGDNGSVGGGIGASYGIIGGSVDFKLAGNLYGSFGLGAAGDDLGYNAGLRYYLLDAERTWRPRLVVNYGTNGLVSRQTCFFSDSNCSDEVYESFEGVSFGFGQSVSFGSNHKHGFDADILYIADDGGKSDRVSELEDEGYELENDNAKIFFSIGYRFNF